MQTWLCIRCGHQCHSALDMVNHWGAEHSAEWEKVRVPITTVPYKPTRCQITGEHPDWIMRTEYELLSPLRKFAGHSAN